MNSTEAGHSQQWGQGNKTLPASLAFQREGLESPGAALETPLHDGGTSDPVPKVKSRWSRMEIFSLLKEMDLPIG